VSTAVLVLGMHRSGTSAMAGALARLDVTLGDRLMDGGEDNPNGYYEHTDVVAAHDELGLRAGRTWDDPRPAAPDLHDEAGRSALVATMRELIVRDFAEAPLWALKDPRLCRFLPGWLNLLDAEGIAACCLLVLRPPDDVAASLARRNGFSSEKSAALWLDHVLEAYRGSHGRRRALVLFDALLDDPATVLARCGEQLGIQWPREPRAAAEELEDFLRPELRHRPATPWAPSPGTLAALADDVWSALRAAGDWPDPATIDGWRHAYAESFTPVSALLLEHATQVAGRLSKDSTWASEQALRHEVGTRMNQLESRIGEVKALCHEFGPRMDELEGRIGGVISNLAEEVAAHSRELVKQGEVINAVEQRLEASRWAVRAWLRRLLGPRD
jgi:hypothetical protein